jgi:hypothetical protein
MQLITTPHEYQISRTDRTWHVAQLSDGEARLMPTASACLTIDKAWFGSIILLRSAVPPSRLKGSTALASAHVLKNRSPASARQFLRAVAPHQ